MTTPKHPMAAITLLAAAALTACGSGGGNGDGTASVNPEHFSGGNDSMAHRINRATSRSEATAFTVSTFGVKLSGDTAAFENQGEVTVRVFRTAPDVMPTVEVTRDGTATTFGPEHEHLRSYRIGESAPDSQDETRLWTWAGYPLEHAEGAYGNGDPILERYHIPIGFSRDTSGTDVRRNFVIGLLTPPGDMPNDVSAVYEGRVEMETWGTEDNSLGGDYLSDIRLTADFADSTITGRLDNWRLLLDGEEYRSVEDTAYVIPETSITGNGFAGELAPAADCIDCWEIVSSEVSGGFYGPAARETGGTIRAEAEHGEIGIGVFHSNRR